MRKVRDICAAFHKEDFGERGEFLEASLDYLKGNIEDVLLDTNTLNRILEVQQLPEDVKEKLFYFIDMRVRDYKAKKAYS